MIFVSLGANPHPFTRLAEAVDRLVGEGKLKEEVVLQLGATPYKPIHITRWARFWHGPEYERILDDCSVIVSHAGLGNAIMARDHSKPLVMVPRMSKLGEHCDDHQLEIADYMAKRGLCLVVRDIADLLPALRQAIHHPPPKIGTGSSRLTEFIRRDVATWL